MVIVHPACVAGVASPVDVASNHESRLVQVIGSGTPSQVTVGSLADILREAGTVGREAGSVGTVGGTAIEVDVMDVRPDFVVPRSRNVLLCERGGPARSVVSELPPNRVRRGARELGVEVGRNSVVARVVVVASGVGLRNLVEVPSVVVKAAAREARVDDEALSGRRCCGRIHQRDHERGDCSKQDYVVSANPDPH